MIVEEIEFIEVNKNNYKKAIEIQQKLFPYEDGDVDILEAIGKRKKTYNFLKYYLVKYQCRYIGITGFYAYDIYPEDAWLTWAGFLANYNTSEINQLSLNFIKKLATQKGFKTLRVYSDEISDKEDNVNYERFGMTKEVYTNEKNKFYSVGKTLIYSISLTNKYVEKWNNKCLFLESHENRNKSKDKEKTVKIDLKKIEYVLVGKENSRNAIKIQQSIFPLENGKQDILESIEADKKNFNFLQYYLIKYEEKFVGITGIYSYKQYPKDAWMAWFGVLPIYRRNGIGTITINFIKMIAKEYKFDSLRVYTDSNSNHYACKLYDQVFELKEIYSNEKGKYYQVGETLIYSSGLNNESVKPWNDKCIFLEAHEKNNNAYTLKYVPIDEQNLRIAGIVQYEIFNESHSCGYSDYVAEVKNKNKSNLPLDFLVYYRNSPIGVIGLYEVPKNSDDIWLNWFGVLPKYRKHGFGTQMLLFALETAKKMGKKNFRLFTYSTWHAKAQGIYKRTMKLEEPYTNKDDNQYCIEQGKPKIFSISLKNKVVERWRNKFIDLTSENELHIESLKQMMKDGLFNDYKNYTS